MKRAIAFVAVMCVSALAVAAPKAPPVESTNYYIRVSAPEVKGASLAVTLLPSRKHEIALEKSKIGKDGLSGWIRMPRILANGGKCELYSGVVLRLMRGREFVERATVGLELAATPGGAPIFSLLPRMVEGGVVTAVVDANAPGEKPKTAFWFPDHLDALEKTLDNAGYAEISSSDLGGFVVNYNFAVKRFKASSEMTRDPRVIAQLKRCGRKLGGNCGMYGEKWLPEDAVTVGYRFITGGRDKGIFVPRDEGWTEQCRSIWEKYRDGIASGSKTPDMVKIGDETTLINFRTNSPALRAAFEAERERLAPELPAEFGMEEMERRNWFRPAIRESRLSRYLTMRALNKETANVYRDVTDELKRALGSQVKTKVNLLAMYYGGGSSSYQTWFFTPDMLLLAREGALDLPEIQGMTPYYPPTGPFADILLSPMFAAQMRELNARPGGRSVLMVFPCRCEDKAYAHTFMSALINADTDLSVYTLGFRASGWEWADLSEKWLAVARCTHWLPKVAPYVVGQSRQKADIAFLATESTDLWRTNALDASKSEMRGSVYALRFSGYRVDFVREHMVEDGFLDGYKVLWATMPNANRVVQKKILEWVAAGGTLVMASGALTHDEADDSVAAFDTFRAVAAADAAPASEFDACKIDSAKPLRTTPVGNGSVVSFPYRAGLAFCAGSARKKGEFRDETIVQSGLDELNGTVRYGVAYWMEGDEAVREKIAAVAEAGGATRQIKLSHGNIDAGVLDDGTRAFVGFANYNVSEVKGLVATFKLKKRYENVKTLDGASVKVEWDGTTARCAFDLGDAQALLFE